MNQWPEGIKLCITLLIPWAIQLPHLGAFKKLFLKKKIDWKTFSMWLLEGLRGITWSYSPHLHKHQALCKQSDFFLLLSLPSTIWETLNKTLIKTISIYPVSARKASYNLDLSFVFLSITLLVSLHYGWVTQKQKGIPSGRNIFTFTGWTSLIIHNNYISNW